MVSLVCLRGFLGSALALCLLLLSVCPSTVRVSASCSSATPLAPGSVVNVAVMVWLPGLPMGLFTGDLASTAAATGGYTALAQPAQLATDMWVKMMKARDGNMSLPNGSIIKINPVYINVAAPTGGWDVEFMDTGVPLFMIAGTYPGFPGSASDSSDAPDGTPIGIFRQVTSTNITTLSAKFGITQAFTYIIPPFLMLDAPTNVLANLVEDAQSHIIIHPFASSRETFVCDADSGMTPDCALRGRLEGARRFETLFAVFCDSTYNTNAALDSFHTLGIKSIAIIQDAWDPSATFTKWAGIQAKAIAASLNIEVAEHYTLTSEGCIPANPGDPVLPSCPPAGLPLKSQNQVFPLNQTARSVAERLKKLSPDALVIVAATVSGGSWTLAQLFMAMQEVGYTPKSISWAGGIDSGGMLAFLPASTMQYTWTTKPWDPRLRGPSYQNKATATQFELLPATATKDGPQVFAEAFEARYGPGRVGGNGVAHPMYSPAWTELCSPAVMWGALMMMQKLVEAAPTLEVPAILAKAPSVSTPGVWHQIQFDRYGRTSRVNEILVQKTQTQPLLLAPYNIGEQPIYPIPTWQERVFEPKWYSQSSEKAVLAVTSISIALCLILMGCVFRYWKSPVIRAATPSFCLVSIAGGVLMLASNYFATLVVSASHCAASTWLLTIGFTLIFSSLFIKTFRIWKIFNRQKLQVLKMKDSTLLLAVGVFILIDIIINAVWMGTAGMDAVVVVVDVNRPSLNYWTCDFADGEGAIFAHLTVKCGLLLFGVGLTWAVRGVPSQFNESLSIALSLYNVTFVVAFIIPIIATGLGGRETVFLIRAFAIIFVVVATLSLLYVPKLVAINSKTRVLPMVNQTQGDTHLSDKGPSSGKPQARKLAPGGMAIEIPPRSPVDANNRLEFGSSGGDRSPKRLNSPLHNKYTHTDMKSSMSTSSALFSPTTGANANVSPVRGAGPEVDTNDTNSP